MTSYDSSNNPIFNSIQSELFNILFNTNTRSHSRNTARRTGPPVEQPAPPPPPPPSYVYSLWSQYNSNIEQYQRIMENNVLPFIQNETDFYNISTTYNNNIYNYQYNFNNSLHQLFNHDMSYNNYIHNPTAQHINNNTSNPRNTTYYAQPTASVRQPTNNDGPPQYYYRSRTPRYEYVIESMFDLDLPELPDINNNDHITNRQILISTHIVPYDSSMNTTCPISYTEFAEGDYVCQIKYCGHAFGSSYLMNWLQNYSSYCPVCRYDLRTYSENNRENIV